MDWVAVGVTGTVRALAHLPATAVVFAATAAVTAGQGVAVIVPVAAEEALAVAAGQGVAVAGVEEAGVEESVVTGAAQDELAQVVHAYREALDSDGPGPDPTEGRRLVFTRHADGSLTGRFDRDAVGGEQVQAAIESIVQADRPKGDQRSRGQQNADALVQVCANQLAAGTLPALWTVEPQVVVAVGLEDLVDPATGPGSATTGFGHDGVRPRRGSATTGFGGQLPAGAGPVAGL